jgi:hypothetical protein
MIHITLTLTGALAALAFSAATVHADSVWPDGPTPFGDSWGLTESYAPGIDGQVQQYSDFSVLNAPDETLVGVVRGDTRFFNGLGDYNVYVEQDISGNVPVGEQYNDFWIGNDWGVVYNSIGRHAGGFLHHAVRGPQHSYLVCRGGGPDLFRAVGPMAGGAVVMRVCPRGGTK